MNLAYVSLSLILLLPVYFCIKRLLMSSNFYPHFYAIILPLVFSAFHLYVFNFDSIPFFNVDITDNDFLHCYSLALGYLSFVPDIIVIRVVIKLYPLYFTFKKLLMSYDVYVNFSAALFLIAFIAFHLYVFNFDYILFFYVSTLDDDFVFYSSIVLAILCSITYMIAHDRSRKKL